VGFHESVEFVVDEPSDGPDDGKDVVDGVADGIVQGCFAVFAGEDVVSVMVAGLVAVAAGGGDGEDREPVFALEEDRCLSPLARGWQTRHAAHVGTICANVHHEAFVTKMEAMTFIDIERGELK
jgi:hypothetical protein